MSIVGFIIFFRVVMEFLAKRVLEFWFGNAGPDGEAVPEKRKRWFIKDPDFDREVKAKFQSNLEPARMGAFDRWGDEPRGMVALIIMLDQFPRNIYRGDEKSFHYDKKAVTLAAEFARKGLFLEVSAPYGYFSLMPFMHAEDKILQETGVGYFTELRDKAPEKHQSMLENALKYAVAHRDIIERFGRFPHRNEILKRDSSPEELEFLKSPGSSF